MINTGISGVTSFLPFKAAPSSWEGSPVGRPVECIVDSVNEGARTVTLRAHRKAVVDAITRGSLLSFNTVIPGMLLNVIVDKIVEVQCSFFLDWNCFVYLFHLAAEWYYR